MHHARRKARAYIAAGHEQVVVHVALAGQGAALPDPDGTARHGPAGHEGQRGLAIAAADVPLIAGVDLSAVLAAHLNPVFGLVYVAQGRDRRGAFVGDRPAIDGPLAEALIADAPNSISPH